MTTPTALPVPSNAAADLLFNAEKLDEVVNTSALTYQDRFGRPRMTVAGAVNDLKSINPRGAWTTATAYAAKDVVSNGGSWYICVDPHTSGATFAGDSARWRVYQGEIFLQSVAGAVARRVVEKLADPQFLSIEDAVPAGFNFATTDCSSYLQAAINDKKIVLLQPGKTYIAKNLTSVTNGALYCLGGRAKVTVPAGSGNWGIRVTHSGFMLCNVDFDGGNYGPYNFSTAAAGTRSGVILGNPTATGVSIAGVCVRDCKITGFDLYGLWGREVYIDYVFGHLVRLDGVTCQQNFVNFFADEKFEYCMATACVGYEGFAGVIVVGGNNRWSNCNFESNYQNAQLAAGVNDAHGTFSCCSFNHAVNGGYGLYALNINNGQVFEGCQFWYSPIHLQGCKGIIIRDSIIAGGVPGGGGVPSVLISGGGFNSISDNWTPAGLAKTFVGTVYTEFRNNLTVVADTSPGPHYGALRMMATASSVAYPVTINATTDAVLGMVYSTAKWHGENASAFLSPSNDVYIPTAGFYEVDASAKCTINGSTDERIFMQVILSRGGSPVAVEPASAFGKAGTADVVVRAHAVFECQPGDRITISFKTSTTNGVTVATGGFRVSVRSER